MFKYFDYSDYKEYHTDTTVRFVIIMTEEKLAEAEQFGLHKKFKLETSCLTSNMVSALILPLLVLLLLLWLCF